MPPPQPIPVKIEVLRGTVTKSEIPVFTSEVVIGSKGNGSRKYVSLGFRTTDNNPLYRTYRRHRTTEPILEGQRRERERSDGIPGEG